MLYSLSHLLAIKYISKHTEISHVTVGTEQVMAQLRLKQHTPRQLALTTPANWLELANQYQKAECLLGKEPPEAELALIRWVLEESTNRCLGVSSLHIIGTDKGLLQFELNKVNNRVFVDVDEIVQPEYLFHLNANRSLILGYTIQETMGHGIQVKTPNGFVRTTTPHKCSCSRWEEAQKAHRYGEICVHINLVRQYSQNKSKWQALGLATLNDHSPATL